TSTNAPNAARPSAAGPSQNGTSSSALATRPTEGDGRTHPLPVVPPRSHSGTRTPATMMAATAITRIAIGLPRSRARVAPASHAATAHTPNAAASHGGASIAGNSGLKPIVAAIAIATATLRVSRQTTAVNAASPT